MFIPGYQIIRKINQGGMSTVYLAIQESVGREVALKVMSPALNADPVFSERFQREANIVGQLSHPNIVAIYDIGRYKNLNYIAMDYLPGGSVHDKMAAGISPQETLRICKEVARALDYAHEKGYIHRDIKPENILFREDNTAVLSDFGVAKTVTTASKMTNAGTVVGTPHYMSPEQARGKAIDGRADIYSLGVVFYEMLTGTVPYKADEAVAIAIKHLTAPIPKLPAQYSVFQKFLNRMLAKDPDERFQRGRDIVAAIEDLESTFGSGGPRYLTQTEPTAVQVYALTKALLLTLYAAIAYKVRQYLRRLFSIRWRGGQGFFKGFYLKRPADFVSTDVDPEDVDKATVVSRRVRHQGGGAPRRPGWWRWLKWTTALLVIALITSSVVTRFNIPGKAQLPPLALSSMAWIDATATAQLRRAGDTISQWLAQASEPAVADPPETVAEPTPQPQAPAAAQSTANEPAAAAEPEPDPEPITPSTFSLTINTQPADARVRIMNIKERYQAGMALEPGSYLVAVDHEGYYPAEEWVRLRQRDKVHVISLRKKPVPGAVFTNALGDGGRGPEMVVVAPGSFIMGDKQQQAATPPHRVNLDYYFAISRYEVTFADYDRFTRATGRALVDAPHGRGNMPVVNVSWEDARDYAAWLTQSTGNRYRLATEAEWEYAARAGSRDRFWWDGGDAREKANCRSGCDSPFVTLFIVKAGPVGSFQANPFGLFDTAGNAAEWVQDCYQPHYLGAPRDGSAIRKSGCAHHVVRGGSYRDSADEITSYFREKVSRGERRSDLGFRVVVELD